MPSSAMDLWANTPAAQAVAYQGVGEINVGQFVLSLLMVIGVLLMCAWLVQRLGWIKKQSTRPEPGDRILFYSQFNAQQSLVLLEQGNQVRCIIYHGKQIEMATDLPGLTAAPDNKNLKKPATNPKKNKITIPASFQEIFKKGLGLKDKQP